GRQWHGFRPAQMAQGRRYGRDHSAGDRYPEEHRGGGGLAPPSVMTEPRKACVVGWPAGHSRSPLIHNYWLRQHGIAGEYVAQPVPPEQFPDFIKGMADRYVGANVTLPHKEAALSLSVPDARARAVGAANTLWFEAGSLRSTNTDVEGFLANLD